MNVPLPTGSRPTPGQRALVGVLAAGGTRPSTGLTHVDAAADTSPSRPAGERAHIFGRYPAEASMLTTRVSAAENNRCSRDNKKAADP